MKVIHAHKRRQRSRREDRPADSSRQRLPGPVSEPLLVQKTTQKDPKTVVLEGLAETTGALESAIEALKQISAIIAFQAAWQQPKQPPAAPYIR